VVHLSNGSYIYTVLTGNKTFKPEVPSGSFTVAGVAYNITIAFLSSPYNLTFQAIGLPSGSLWYVDLSVPCLLRSCSSNTTVDVGSSVTPFITFGLINGTYPYRVPLHGVYTPNRVTGSVNITGANMTIPVQFVKAQYTITFAESGLASGTSWSVTLDGLTEQSTNSTIVFLVANGTFPYSIQTSGGAAASPASGLIRVAGASTTMSVTFTASSGSGSGGLSGPQIAVLAGLVAAGAIVVGALLLSRRSRRAPPPPAANGTSASEAGTPSAMAPNPEAAPETSPETGTDGR
jgi:hypothetical protein